MRVAVTGARGFIGSSLVPVLEARGHEVVSVSRDALFSAPSFARCEAVVHLANIAHRAAGASLLEADNYCCRPSGFLESSGKLPSFRMNTAKW